MPGKFIELQKWIACALILVGALVACSTAPAPVGLIATATLIPSTATHTPTPLTPSPTTPATATSIPTATAAVEQIIAIVAGNVTPDSDLLTEIFADLADELSVSVNRVQLVRVEAAMWSRRTLGCDTASVVPISVIADDPDREVEGFRYILVVGNTLYEYHTEGVERFIRCPDAEQAQDELLIAIDPVAADILRLAQRRVAEELDLSTRRIQLVAMSAVMWPDTSLGCPQEEQTYNETQQEGYRLVVRAGDNDYIFHSDAISIYPCTVEQEVLPEEES